MKHIHHILYASAILAPLTSATAKEKSADNNERPNVILIVADDLGYGDLGCYGAKDVKTPNVDRLAKNGIRFLNSHAAAATSTPSRYALLTGHYAWRRPDTRIAEGNASMIIRPEQYTMADMFRNAGYTTAAIGKWHLGLGDKTAEQDWNAPIPCGCPGTNMKTIQRQEQPAAAPAAAQTSQLRQWPVQIKLVPVRAPYFEGADLLIAADCTAFAHGNFHEEFIRNHITLIGCPKLDEGDYADKLTAIISKNDIKSVTILRMEVPCCGGIENAVKQALQKSGKFIPWQVVIISTDGKIIE